MSFLDTLTRGLERNGPPTQAGQRKRQRTAALQDLADFWPHSVTRRFRVLKARQMIRQVLEAAWPVRLGPLPLSAPACRKLIAPFFRTRPSKAGLSMLLATAILLL